MEPFENEESARFLFVIIFFLLFSFLDESSLDSVTGPECQQQCDQIWRFIGLWATFQSLWQRLI